VGTGPFKFVSWDRGQRVVLEKNPTYWKFPVKVERVIYRPIVEDQARLTELLTGTLDVIVGAPPYCVDQLESSRKSARLWRVGELSERVRDHALGAGIRLGHAITGRDDDRDAVQPEIRRRERDAPDHGVGRVPREAPLEGAGALRALVDGRLGRSRHGDVPAA